jgi:Rv2175c C-terminal domain of unknown function
VANDTNPQGPPDNDLHDGDDLEELVGDWLTVPDIGEMMGLRLSDVRQLIEDRHVLGLRVGPRNVMSVPAKFFNDAGPLPELPGTFTVLGDGRMSDAQILRWLFTPDESLPVPGAPIDALLGGFKTEVRRRAMEAAY